MIQTVKKALKQSHDGNEDPYLTLLILNTTPGTDGISPAMRLFNNQPRMTLLSLNMTRTTSPQKITSTKIISQQTTRQGSVGHSTWYRRPHATSGKKAMGRNRQAHRQMPGPRAYLILNETTLHG